MEPGLLEALLELPGASCRPVTSADTARGLAGSRQARLELEGEALELLAGPQKAPGSLAPLLAELGRAARALDAPPGPPQLMGVLNVTPDSFSDGGRYLEPELAIEHGVRMWREGATWIDVGGESTRPGSEPVEPEEQLRRVLPVLRGLRDRIPEARISIDTTRAEVAEGALEAGASLVNDVSGGQDDPRLLPLVARAGCGLALMHRRGSSASMQEAPEYEDVVDEVARFLRSRVRSALDAGVRGEAIWLDPGIGFGKRLEHNLELLRRLPELRSIGLPLLLGVSRKSFIGHVTGAERQEEWRQLRDARELDRERVGGTAAAVAACVEGGADVLRVHDVALMFEATAVAAAIAGRPLPGEGQP